MALLGKTLAGHDGHAGPTPRAVPDYQPATYFSKDDFRFTDGPLSFHFWRTGPECPHEGCAEHVFNYVLEIEVRKGGHFMESHVSARDIPKLIECLSAGLRQMNNPSATRVSTD